MNSILTISYLIASITFVVGLKKLSHPESARKGNIMAGVGMFIAIFATIFLYKDEAGVSLGNYVWIFGGLLVGTVLGTIIAKKVKMTAMPQMVSLFNGMGGACAAIIGIVEFNHMHHTGVTSMMNTDTLIVLAGLIIGSISFAGSMIAYGKLDGKIKDKTLPLGQFINVGLLLAIAGLTYYIMTQDNANITLMYTLLGISTLYGVLFVMPIGGADMPVVISLLNSFTGVAAAFAGFLYGNMAMLTGGILVGSAGTILTMLMCTAMNRSLLNVIIGSFGGNSSAGGVQGEDGGTIKEISATDLAVLLKYSQKVYIVPGYGLAVAQAQHVCNELTKKLAEEGVDTKFAIHPVAGRMPGHMNVLLAEADVDYDSLMEMEEANPEMDSTDVVMVIGANDVVNPAALTDTSSPIYGMPIIEVNKAKNVIVMKRSMGTGYAGIQNQLFFGDNTRMLFGDAKDSLQKILGEIKNI